MQSILLATTSPLKLATVMELFPPSTYTITTIDCNDINLPPQPYRSAFPCAKQRLNYIKSKATKEYDYYISIENGMEIREDYPLIHVDVCCVIIEYLGVISAGSSLIKFYIPTNIVNKCKESGEVVYPELEIKGFNTTIGEIMHQDDPAISKNNWMKTFYKKDRVDQIKEALENAMITLQAKKIILTYLREKYPSNFITDDYDLRSLASLVYSQYQYDCIDYFVVDESSEYIYTAMSSLTSVAYTDSPEIVGKRVVLLTDSETPHTIASDIDCNVVDVLDLSLL